MSVNNHLLNAAFADDIILGPIRFVREHTDRQYLAGAPFAGLSCVQLAPILYARSR